MCRTGRKVTPSIPSLLHAYHCKYASCSRPACAETKWVLQRMAAHARCCEESVTCNVCKLWAALGAREPNERRRAEQAHESRTGARRPNRRTRAEQAHESRTGAREPNRRTRAEQA
jgi:hypothetical protein